MGSMLEYDLVVIGSGPGGQKAAIAAAKLGKSVAVDRTRQDARRCLRQHRHHPVQDAARGGRLPDRHEPARAVRRQLPGQGEDHARPTCWPAPSTSSARRVDVVRNQLMRNRVDLLHRARPVRRRAHRLRRGPDPRRKDHRQRRIHRHRHRHQAGAPGRRRVRRGPGAGLRRHPRPEVAPGVDGGRRRGRDRHRVRVDVRRARHQGHGRREARHHAGLLRSRSRRGAEVPPARPRGDVPVRRGGDRPSTSAPRARSPRWPAASRSPPRR